MCLHYLLLLHLNNRKSKQTSFYILPTLIKNSSGNWNIAGKWSSNMKFSGFFWEYLSEVLIQGYIRQTKTCLTRHYRSGRWRCSIEKTVLKISAILTGNHQGWSLSLIKLQAFRLATLKRSSNTGVSLWILRNF